MIRKTLEVNTLGHLYTIREFLPSMITNNKGHIVTVSSVAGLVGTPGLSDYCASKFGAFGIDESLRTEMKKQNYNVKTTCVCPYFINTGMFDGVKASGVFRILDQHYVVKRIVNAIRQEEEMLVLPWTVNLVFLMRLLPLRLADLLAKYTGSY